MAYYSSECEMTIKVTVIFFLKILAQYVISLLRKIYSELFQ